jgi:hypothetical protein
MKANDGLAPVAILDVLHHLPEQTRVQNPGNLSGVTSYERYQTKCRSHTKPRLEGS